MKKWFSIYLFLLLGSTLFAQNQPAWKKDFKGDTFYLKWDRPLHKKLKLKDLSISKDPFFFRFKDVGQFVEIWKDSSGKVTGSLTCFVFWSKLNYKKRSDTLFSTTPISEYKARILYNEIQNSGVEALPTDRDIKGWTKNFFDGYSYEIEFSNPYSYHYKSYNNPNHHDTLKEAIQIDSLGKKIHRQLNLDSNYKAFEHKYEIRNGTYNKGEVSSRIILTNSLSVGYHGNSKMPFGLYASFYKSRVGNFKLNLFGSIVYKTDTRNNFDFTTYINRNNIFFKNQSDADAITFQFRLRHLNLIPSNNLFRNYEMTYRKSFSNLSISLGFDVLQKSNIDFLGGVTRISFRFSKLKVDASGKFLFYKDHFDFRAGLSKSLYIQKQVFTIECFYEKFYNYYDINLTIIYKIPY